RSAVRSVARKPTWSTHPAYNRAGGPARREEPEGARGLGRPVRPLPTGRGPLRARGARLRAVRAQLPAARAERPPAVRPPARAPGGDLRRRWRQRSRQGRRRDRRAAAVGRRPRRAGRDTPVRGGPGRARVPRFRRAEHRRRGRRGDPGLVERLEEFLAGRRIACLATENPDGSAYLTAVWFLYE